MDKETLDRIMAGNAAHDPEALEPFRLACEARWVMALPTKEERRAWITKISKRRGPAAAAELRQEVLRQWGK